jgi:hypothetical protein
MDRSALDIYMTTCAVESVGLLEWLQTCYYSQGGNIRVYGTDIAFDDDISTMPACKYAALFDSRKCFDGLRFSFLSRICEPKWQNIDQCWPHDLDEAQTEQLVVFYTRHFMPLQKRGVPVEQPSDFFGMAWQAFRDALATGQTFFLSYDELLLLCALRKRNIIIFGKREDDGHLQSIGELLYDSSKPVVALSSGHA